MKCAKCGYISFDHHSECKKCQTSMASVREGLGFSAARPAAPSLLGSLLRDSPPTVPQKNQAAETEAHAPISLQEEISGALNEAFQSEPTVADRAAADPAAPQEDFSLLDLSDEELELLIEEDGPGHAEREKIESSGPAQGDGDKYAPGPPSSLDAASSPPGIEMAEDAGASLVEEPLLSFDGFLETDTPGLLDPAADSTEAPVRLDSEQGPTLEFAQAEKPPEVRAPGAENEFVIDLSETELDALLQRLEGATKEKA